MRFFPRINRIDSPADAAALMKRAGVSPRGIELMIPKLDFVVLHLSKLRHPAATILKQEALAVGAEAAVHRGLVVREVDHTDVILGGTLTQLQRLTQKLGNQQFGLSVLAAEITTVLEQRNQQPTWRVGGQQLDLSRPLIMGVINLTDDSFSGDGLADSVENALAQSRAMLAAGADILDLGAESSRPGATPLTSEVELARLLPVIKLLKAETDALLSVDTYKPQVAREALSAGARIVNDITGLREMNNSAGMAEVAAEYDAGIVIMHMQGEPGTMQSSPSYDDLGADIHRFFAEQIEAATSAGLNEENIVLDPGIGFGKTLAHNLTLLNHLEWFTSLGRPILVGASRKSFIGQLTDAPVEERLPGTIAAHTIALLRGARIIRVHDVAEAKQMGIVTNAIRSSGI